jgi:hypothetical protein
LQERERDQVQGAKSKVEIKKEKAELNRQRDAGEISKEEFEEKFNKLMQVRKRARPYVYPSIYRCNPGRARVRITISRALRPVC